jgi:hypothetical protein
VSSLKLGLVVVWLAGVPASVQAQGSDSTLQRPSAVVVKIANDPSAAYNGIYRASGVSIKCGLADYGYPHRLNSFAISFPYDTGTKAVTSVEFDADTLKSGTTGHSFYLSVGIRVGERGTPPLYVIRAKQPQYDEPGTAALIKTSKGADSLTVKGIASKGRKVDVEMTFVCQR